MSFLFTLFFFLEVGSQGLETLLVAALHERLHARELKSLRSVDHPPNSSHALQ